MKARITNNSPALQGVHSVSGLVFIDPGKTERIDVAPDHVERVKRLGFLAVTFDEAATPAKASVELPKAAPAKARRPAR